FNYPFNPEDLPEAYAYDGDIENASLGSMMMTARRAPILRHGDGVASALSRVSFAYHLDNAPFVRFLADPARRIGGAHPDTTIADVAVGTGGAGEPVVDHLVNDGGEKLVFDFYVDCTGFRSRILGQALGSPFDDFDDSLYCDSAVVANVPHDGSIKPYTVA